MEKIKWILNQMPKNEDKNLAVMALDNVNQARKFHRSFPQYSVTPLAKLDGMAGQLGLGGLFVKDESYRFGLNAFKVLGGSFAMAKYIAKEMGKDVSEMTYDYLTSKKFRDDFGQATFFTATDGNHGRGVAWAANKLGQKAVVHMPKGSTQTRFDNIAKEMIAMTLNNLSNVKSSNFERILYLPISCAPSILLMISFAFSSIFITVFLLKNRSFSSIYSILSGISFLFLKIVIIVSSPIQFFQTLFLNRFHCIFSSFFQE